jgi:hypothetical protein
LVCDQVIVYAKLVPAHSNTISAAKPTITGCHASRRRAHEYSSLKKLYLSVLAPVFSTAPEHLPEFWFINSLVTFVTDKADTEGCFSIYRQLAPLGAFVREMGEPATSHQLPVHSPPDLNRLGAVAAKYGSTILGRLPE